MIAAAVDKINQAKWTYLYVRRPCGAKSNSEDGAGTTGAWKGLLQENVLEVREFTGPEEQRPLETVRL